MASPCLGCTPPFSPSSLATTLCLSPIVLFQPTLLALGRLHISCWSIFSICRLRFSLGNELALGSGQYFVKLWGPPRNCTWPCTWTWTWTRTRSWCWWCPSQYLAIGGLRPSLSESNSSPNWKSNWSTLIHNTEKLEVYFYDFPFWFCGMTRI